MYNIKCPGTKDSKSCTKKYEVTELHPLPIKCDNCGCIYSQAETQMTILDQIKEVTI